MNIQKSDAVKKKLSQKIIKNPLIRFMNTFNLKFNLTKRHYIGKKEEWKNKIPIQSINSK